MNEGQARILESVAHAGAPTYGGLGLYIIVQSWHDEHHAGAFRFCDEQPCHAIHLARR